MKKLAPLALVLGLLFVVVPAAADHIQEPTAPINGLRTNHLNYSTGTPVPCNDLETPFDFDIIRIQAFVSAEAAPSEHFRAQVQVWRVEEIKPSGSLVRKADWGIDWHHSNIPPHVRSFAFNADGTAGGWKFTGTGSATYFLGEHPGIWQIVTILTGDASGNVFTDSCLFVIPE